MGVSAGFSLFSLGVETDGSIGTPASRAELFGLKPTLQTVSLDGILVVTSDLDSPGPMARSAADLALVLETIQTPTTSPRNYSSALTGNFKGLKVGFLDEKVWRLPESLTDLKEEVLTQIVRTHAPAIVRYAV